MFGQVTVDLPVNVVKAVSDVITLKKTTAELRLSVERHEK